MRRLLPLLFLLVASVNVFAQTGTVTIDPNTSYNTQIGWEATGRMLEASFPTTYTNWRTAVINGAVDLGINRIRVEVYSGTENPTDYFQQYLNGQITLTQANTHRYETINDNPDPNVLNPAGFTWARFDQQFTATVLPLKAALAAQGEQLFINVCLVDFSGGTRVLRDFPLEYGEFVLTVYQHMQSTYGFVPNAWEGMLEPDAATAGPWTAVQLANGLAAARARLIAAGFTPNFIAPSTQNGSNLPLTWYNQMKAQSAVAVSSISEVSYHRYSAPSVAQLTALRDAVALDGKTTFMSEFIGADYNTLWVDLQTGRNTSWQEFVLASDIANGDTGSDYFMITPTPPYTVTMASRAKILRQVFKYVRRGAVMKATSTTNVNCDGLAWRNTAGNYAIALKATGGPCTFTVNGAPAGTYHKRWTTATLYDQALADQAITAGQSLTGSIPAAGILTLFADAAPPGQTDFYVSPAGTGSTCTVAAPCSLTTVLAGNGGTVLAGATIWARGGLYNGKFSTSLTGTVSAPIILRAYPGESPIIEGYLTTTLSAAISNSQSTLTLADGAKFPAGGTIIIADQPDPGSEEHLFLGIKSGNNYSNVQRGWDGTTALAHASGALVVLGGNQLTTNGNYFYVRDLELRNSDPVRTQIPLNSQNAPHFRGECVFNLGDNNKVINNWIHDCQEGYFNSPSAIGSEVYGNLIQNDGYVAGGAFNGHGLYLIHEDQGTTAFIRENIVLNSSANGIKGNSQNGSTVNITMQGNVSFNNGSWAQTNNLRWQVEVGSNNGVANNITLDANFLYSPTKGTDMFSLGFGGLNNGPLTVTGNYAWGGGSIMNLQKWTPLTVTGNTLFARNNPGAPGANSVMVNFNAATGQSGTFNNNNYYNLITNGLGYYFNGGSALTFANWKTASGFDAASVQTQAAAPAFNTVRPNTYDPDRGNIIVFNPQLLSAVNVNISPVVAVGQTYVIRSAESFNTIIASGTYAGGTIALPMNGTTVAQPIGWTTNIPTVRPEFGAFIIQAGAVAPPIGPTITNVSLTHNCDTSVLVNFTTDVVAHSYVEYGLTTAYGFSTIDDPDRYWTEHGIALTGLGPGSLYHYRIHANDGTNETISGDFTVTMAANGTACPALPVDVDTRMVNTAGFTIRTVKASGGNYLLTQLQNAFNDATAAGGNWRIIVDSGSVITGNYTLPNHSGSNWIQVESSALAAPAGQRVLTSDSFFTIKSMNTTAPLSTAASAHHWRFIGMNLTIDPSAQTDAPGGVSQSGLFRIGTGAETTTAQLPHHIVVDRSYIHGNPLKNDTRGIYINGEDVGIIDSTILEIHDTGADAQAILGGMAKRVKILNCHLQSTGENFMAGGVGITISGYTPSDYTITRNYFDWKLSWKSNDGSWDGKFWVVKNHLEVKNGRKVFTFGNVFQRWWSSNLHGQTGGHIVLKSSNEDTTSTVAEGSDFVFYKNYSFDVGSGFQLGAGSSATQASTTNYTKRASVMQNLAVIDGATWNNEDNSTDSVAMATGINDATLSNLQTIDIPYLTVNHNSFINANGSPGNISLLGGAPTAALAPGFQYLNNIVGHGAFGFKGSGLTEGTPTLNAIFTSYTWDRNLIVGTGGTYPNDSLRQSAWSGVGFTNFNNGLPGGNFLLTSGSPGHNAATDGTDIGVNYAAVQRATVGAISGNWINPTPPGSPICRWSDLVPCVPQ